MLPPLTRAARRRQVSALCALGLAALLTACAQPRNVAVSQSPLSLGSVHRAKLEAIYPVFVPGGLTVERYGATSASAGALVADLLLENDSRIDQITELSGNAAEAVSGAYEERYNGGICQFFLRTRDADLIELSLDTDTDEDYDELVERLEDELDELNYESRDLISAFDDATYEFEDSSSTLRDYVAEAQAGVEGGADAILDTLQDQVRTAENQVETLRTLLANNAERINAIERRIKQPPPAEERVVAVNNPCRRFELGETLLVVSVDQGTEFILQPSY